jgi:hypothetical protein
MHMQCAHIMAMAVQRLHKDAQVTIGPWIDRGFYYDFDLATPLSDKELKAIRKEMQKIIRMNLPFIREEVRRRQQRQGQEEAGRGQQTLCSDVCPDDDGNVTSGVSEAGAACHLAGWHSTSSSCSSHRNSTISSSTQQGVHRSNGHLQAL